MPMTERDTPERAGQPTREEAFDLRRGNAEDYDAFKRAGASREERAEPQGCPHEAWEADGDGERCADCHAPGIVCPYCNSTLAAPTAPPVERGAREERAGEAQHGNHEARCLCPGCPTMVPGCWAAGMCFPCATEDCEHEEAAPPPALETLSRDLMGLKHPPVPDLRPAHESPPRPESFEDNLRRNARGTGSQAAEWFAERVIAAAQPNAESPAGPETAFEATRHAFEANALDCAADALLALKPEELLSRAPKIEAIIRNGAEWQREAERDRAALRERLRQERENTLHLVERVADERDALRERCEALEKELSGIIDRIGSAHIGHFGFYDAHMLNVSTDELARLRAALSGGGGPSKP